MSFIPSIVNTVLGANLLLIAEFEELVEQVVDVILDILGFGPQTLEYYQVQNIALFPNPDNSNPLLSSIQHSILTNSDINSNLLYAITFRSMKVNVRRFMAFIEDGDYFEGFPSIESFILYIDYDELAAALLTLNGVASTPEQSSIASLSDTAWVQYWLQENKVYDVGINRLTDEFSSDSTSPATPATTGVTVTPSANHYDVAITDEVVTSDALEVDSRWQVDFSGIVYNSGPDNYSVDVFNDAGDTATLGYTVPSKPLQLHYISYYYIDSAPDRQYIFIYQVGAGTYPDLDTIETPITLDGTSLQVIPAIPLRITNANYTTFGATKATQIEDICDIIDLDAAAILDGVLTDSGVTAGDLDNIYITFGVRMWDTCQPSLAYLFNMFENIFPAQGVTQGIYDAADPADAKPANNIIVRTDDYESVFQFSYITFEFFSLATIDADSGSDENGIYYSDLSKFNAANELVYPYYSSSGKGTYNVGYKADTLAEVADFLAGNGVVNPGTTSTEAANWLQTTTRLKYTLALNDATGSPSTLDYLTPDLVFENNGGTLQLVASASEETTKGQSITYYYCTEVGLEAYTVVAPISILKVIDGDSGRFNLVKFNLGNEEDLMTPLVHTFIKDLSNKNVTQIMLAASHVSIYIAHYEVIELAGWAKLLLVVLIVIVVVITYYFPPAATEAWALAATAFAAGSYGLAVLIILSTILPSILLQIALKLIVTEVAKHNEELALILGIVAAIGFAYYSSGTTLTGLDFAKAAVNILESFNLVLSIRAERLEEELNLYRDELSRDTRLSDLEKLYEDIFDNSDSQEFSGLNSNKRASLNGMYPEDMFVIYEGQVTGQYLMYETASIIDTQVSGEALYI